MDVQKLDRRPQIQNISLFLLYATLQLQEVLCHTTMLSAIYLDSFANLQLYWFGSSTVLELK